MKEWSCIQVEDHRKVAETIENLQRDGWHLHTYQATGRDIWIKHYLLFEKEQCNLYRELSLHLFYISRCKVSTAS